MHGPEGLPGLSAISGVVRVCSFFTLFLDRFKLVAAIFFEHFPPSAEGFIVKFTLFAKAQLAHATVLLGLYKGLPVEPFGFNFKYTGYHYILLKNIMVITITPTITRRYQVQYSDAYGWRMSERAMAR
jgi:hypothetical protein